MSTENKQDTRHTEILSGEAWESLGVIHNAIATFGYVVFLADNMKGIQEYLRKIAPDIKEGYRNSGDTLLNSVIEYDPWGIRSK